MKTKEIKKQTDKELEKLLVEQRAAYRSFRFDITGSKVKNVKDGAKIKKTIARVLTEIKERNA